MSCLHIITTSRLPDDFAALCDEDEAVLVAEGAYLSMAGHIKATAAFAGTFVVEDDLKMRGLPENPAEFRVIGQQQLVALVLKHEKTITWS